MDDEKGVRGTGRAILLSMCIAIAVCLTVHFMF